MGLAFANWNYSAGEVWQITDRDYGPGICKLELSCPV